MNSDTAKMVVQQLIAFISIWATFSKRLKSAIVIANAILEKWDEVWALINGTSAMEPHVMLTAPATTTPDLLDHFTNAA